MTSKSAITPSLSGRMAEIVPGGCGPHPLGLDADGVHLTRARVDRDHAGLGEHDSAPSHVYEGICGAQIHRHVAAAETG